MVVHSDARKVAHVGFKGNLLVPKVAVTHTGNLWHVYSVFLVIFQS